MCRCSSFVGVCLFAAALSVPGFAAHPAPLPVKDSQAKTEAEMKPYIELVEHSDAKIEMLPIKGGKFVMGSPASEQGRKTDEGPQHEVQLSPFWMAKCEITWDAYEVWMADTDINRRQVLMIPATERDKLADPFQLSQPTKPYTDMTSTWASGLSRHLHDAACLPRVLQMAHRQDGPLLPPAHRG